VRVFELSLVFWQQGTGSVKVVFFGYWIVGQGVQLATQWLFIAQIATIDAQVLALILNAQTPKTLGLFLSQRNFKRAITLVNMTATLTLSAMIEKQANVPIFLFNWLALCIN
jgi:hypothetical protein